MYSVLVSLLAFTFLHLTEARLSPGRCPRPPTQANFNLTRFLGQWYGQLEYTTFFNLGVGCSRALFSLKPSGKLKIYNQGFYRLINHSVTVDGEAEIINHANPAALNVRFFGLLPPIQYLVVETDYDTYSVVYSCQNQGFIKNDLAWVLTRNKEGLDQVSLNEILQRLETKGIESDHFEPILQTDCPF